MADNTAIEWTDATWNPITGCSVTSPGCTNCYAMQLAGTRLKHVASRAGLTRQVNGNHVWTGETRFNEAELLQPLRWRRPRRIFVCAHGDLFHESVPDEWIDRVFAVLALAPQHTFQVLTKRADRMREYFRRHADFARHAIYGLANDRLIDWIASDDVAFTAAVNRLATWPLPNVWLGVSVEDQARADERVPDLLATPAAVRWLSCEPLLGPVDLRWIAEPDEEKDGVIDALLGCNWIDNGRGEEFRPVRPGHQDRVMRRWVCSAETDILANRKLDWIVVGGESGKDARPMHPDWARSLRDQCQSAGVPFFFKQWGEWLPWEPEQLLCWKAQDGRSIDRHALPDFNDTRLKGWSDRLLYEGDDICVHERVGKKRAGRLLDGREWSEFPA